jgi:hypothetical protein
MFDIQTFDSKPGIKGSNAYDVIIGLQEKGIAKPETEITSDGYRWTSRSTRVGQTVMHYAIEANNDYEIYRAYFTMNGEDNGFIKWITTLPHDALDPSIKEFVMNCMKNKESDSITVGDGIWGVIVGTNGVMIELMHVDSEAYFMYTLFN